MVDSIIFLVELEFILFLVESEFHHPINWWNWNSIILLVELEFHHPGSYAVLRSDFLQQSLLHFHRRWLRK